MLRCHWFNVCPCVSDDIGLANVTNNYSSSSTESTPRVGMSNGTNYEVKVEKCSTARERSVPFIVIFIHFVFWITL